MTTTTAGFGKTRLGNKDFWKRFTLQQPKPGEEYTDAEYRIIPPIKSCAEDGIWGQYFSIHYGFEGRDRKDQTKGRTRTFMCIQDRNRKTKEVIKHCPQCDAMALVEEEAERIEAEAKAEGRTEDEIKTLVAGHKAWLHKFNVDRKWYINVMNSKGEFGVLLLSHRTKTQLDGLMKEMLEKDGVDATDIDTGVFFNFRRTGRNQQVQDTVSVAMVSEKVNGKAYMTPKLAPLTPDQQKQALQILPDLRTDVMTVLSLEQIGRLVALGRSPDLDVVDAIFDSSKPREKAPAVPKVPETSQKPEVKPIAPPPDLGPEEPDDGETASTLPAKAKTPDPAPAAPQDEMAILKAKLAAMEAAAAQKAAAPAPAVPAATPVADPSKVSDAQFAQMFGSGVAKLPGEAPKA